MSQFLSRCLWEHRPLFSTGKIIQDLCRFVNCQWTMADAQATLFEVYRNYCGADVVKKEIKYCTEQPVNSVGVEHLKLERRERMCVSVRIGESPHACAVKLWNCYHVFAENRGVQVSFMWYVMHDLVPFSLVSDRKYVKELTGCVWKV